MKYIHMNLSIHFIFASHAIERLSPHKPRQNKQVRQ